MKATLLTLLLIGSLTFLILAIIGKQKIFQHAKFMGIFFLFYFVDNLAITLTKHFSRLQFVPNHLWNDFLLCSWSGKAYSILNILSLLYLFRFFLPIKNIGISIQQNNGSLIPSAVILLGIGLWASFVGSKLAQGDFDIKVLVYLVVMPGLNEELVYRGVLPACLERLFPKNWILASAQIGWSTLITTAVFGLLHSLWLDSQFELNLEIVWIRNAPISGFIFAWLRERTGSLIMPIIAHGTWDFFIFSSG